MMAILIVIIQFTLCFPSYDPFKNLSVELNKSLREKRILYQALEKAYLEQARLNGRNSHLPNGYFMELEQNILAALDVEVYRTKFIRQRVAAHYTNLIINTAADEKFADPIESESK